MNSAIEYLKKELPFIKIIISQSHKNIFCIVFKSDLINLALDNFISYIDNIISPFEIGEISSSFARFIQFQPLKSLDECL